VAHALHTGPPADPAQLAQYTTLSQPLHLILFTGGLWVLLGWFGQFATYLHSGVRGRSYLTNAKAHVAGEQVIKTDVCSFYHSTTTRHVFVGLPREFKCSGDVARLIANISTYRGHLPTGSPVSMLLTFYAPLSRSSITSSTG
jgi:hypothetical protein